MSSHCPSTDVHAEHTWRERISEWRYGQSKRCPGITPQPPPLVTEWQVVYQRFDYRINKYTGRPTIMYRSDQEQLMFDRLEVERSASGAPEEWWVQKVTTERISL